MDAFFASVEQRDHPALRGKPIAVGHAGARGVVATASYEARKFGVHSAMPSSKARELCPQLIFVHSRMRHYQAVSRQVREIFERYTDIIEPVSIDEAYLDVTVNKIDASTGLEIAKLIKQNIQHPLIANGEITSPQIAKKVQELTGAEGVMIGRAAIEKPWIFTQIKNNLEESIELRKQVALEHFDRTISFRGDYGAIMFRKNLHAYSKGLKGASDFRNKVNAITNPALMREEIFNFFTHSSFET